MNQWTQRRDIERTITDGISAVIRSELLRDRPILAKNIAQIQSEIATEIADRLQTAFSIRRPKKR